MQCEIQNEAKLMVDRFVCGDFDRIASAYEFPAAVYWGDAMRILRDKNDLMYALSSYRAAMLEMGVRSASSKAMYERKKSAGRLAVVVFNQYFDESGEPVCSSKIRYFVKCSNNPRVQMVEYLKRPCEVPEFSEVQSSNQPADQADVIARGDWPTRELRKLN